MNKVIDFKREKQKRTDAQDIMVPGQTRKAYNALYEVMASEGFNLYDPLLQNDLLFIRRCIQSCINRQYGITDDIQDIIDQYVNNNKKK